MTSNSRDQLRVHVDSYHARFIVQVINYLFEFDGTASEKKGVPLRLKDTLINSLLSGHGGPKAILNGKLPAFHNSQA